MKTSKQIIVMRNDLNMRKGKMCAQASHASLKTLLDLTCLKDGYEPAEYLTIPMFQEKLTTEDSEDSAIKDWLRGRFTKVCVAVNSEEELLEVYSKAKAKGLLCSLITDAGLTEFNGVATLTCCAIGPVWSNELEGITDHLKLL